MIPYHKYYKSFYDIYVYCIYNMHLLSDVKTDRYLFMLLHVYCFNFFVLKTARSGIILRNVKILCKNQSCMKFLIIFFVIVFLMLIH